MVRHTTHDPEDVGLNRASHSAFLLHFPFLHTNSPQLGISRSCLSIFDVKSYLKGTPYRGVPLFTTNLSFTQLPYSGSGP